MYHSYMNHVAAKVDPLMFSLLHAARVLEDRLETALSTVDLSRPKLSVLTQLVLKGEPMTLSDLAAGLACVRSNMTQLVDRLEADGLVRRIADGADRRIVRAELTQLGRERQAAGAEQMEKVQAGFAALLMAEDRPVLERALEALKR
jgi:DNA-binding MarR family transcriptional regulator